MAEEDLKEVTLYPLDEDPKVVTAFLVLVEGESTWWVALPTVYPTEKDWTKCSCTYLYPEKTSLAAPFEFFNEHFDANTDLVLSTRGKRPDSVERLSVCVDDVKLSAIFFEKVIDESAIRKKAKKTSIYIMSREEKSRLDKIYDDAVQKETARREAAVADERKLQEATILDSTAHQPLSLPTELPELSLLQRVRNAKRIGRRVARVPPLVSSSDAFLLAVSEKLPSGSEADVNDDQLCEEWLKGVQCGWDAQQGVRYCFFYANEKTIFSEMEGKLPKHWKDQDPVLVELTESCVQLPAAEATSTENSMAAPPIRVFVLEGDVPQVVPPPQKKQHQNKKSHAVSRKRDREIESVPKRTTDSNSKKKNDALREPPSVAQESDDSDEEDDDSEDYDSWDDSEDDYEEEVTRRRTNKKKAGARRTVGGKQGKSTAAGSSRVGSQRKMSSRKVKSDELLDPQLHRGWEVVSSEHDSLQAIGFKMWTDPEEGGTLPHDEEMFFPPVLSTDLLNTASVSGIGGGDAYVTFASSDKEASTKNDEVVAILTMKKGDAKVTLEASQKKSAKKSDLVKTENGRMNENLHTNSGASVAAVNEDDGDQATLHLLEDLFMTIKAAESQKEKI